MNSTTRVERIEAPPLALTIAWKNEHVASFKLGRARDEETPALTLLAQKYRDALKRYVAGEPVQWPDAPLDMSKLSGFSRRVLTTLKKHAGHGALLSYGQLARLSGSPGAARAVGQVMANNAWPLIYPCHRVISSTGKLTGFSAQHGIETKALLLKLESKQRN